MSEELHHEETEVPGVQHEERDVNTPALAFTGAGLIVALLITAAIVALLSECEGRGKRIERLEPTFRKEPVPPQPEPGIEVQPRRVLIKVRSENLERLRGYEWVDRQQNIARIPIERAMEIAADRLPDRSQSDAGEQKPGGTP